MRDIVQNHVLQVLSLFLMEPPTSFHPEAIRDEKVKLLRAIRPLDEPAEIAGDAVRGQYTRGGTREDLMPGYREEPGVDPLSSTETFVALRLRHRQLALGRRPGLRPHRQAAAARESPRSPSSSSGRRSCRCSRPTAATLEPDALIVRVQPDEGLSLRFGAKVPGPRVPGPQGVDGLLLRRRLRASSEPDAYERVILDALIGDPTLFIRADEVGRSWRIVDPLLQYWAPRPGRSRCTRRPPGDHPKRTQLIERDGRRWRDV